MAKSRFNNVDKGLMQAPMDLEDEDMPEREVEDEGPDSEEDYTVEEDEDGGAVITYSSSIPSPSAEAARADDVRSLRRCRDHRLMPS